MAKIKVLITTVLLTAVSTVVGVHARQSAASSAAGIEVAPFPDTAIRPGVTLIYSPAFTAAWAELKDLTRGDVDIVENDPIAKELLRKLNAQYPPYSLQPDIAAAGGLVRDGVINRFKKVAMDKWGMIPAIGWEPDDRSEIWCLAYLRKQLRFPSPYPIISDPLWFNEGDHTIPARGFGFSVQKNTNPNLVDQSVIAYYRSPDEFVVVLKTCDETEVVLSCIPPNETIGETTKRTDHLIAQHSPSKFTDGDTLHIPFLEM